MYICISLTILYFSFFIKKTKNCIEKMDKNGKKMSRFWW